MQPIYKIIQSFFYPPYLCYLFENRKNHIFLFLISCKYIRTIERSKYRTLQLIYNPHQCSNLLQNFILYRHKWFGVFLS